MAIDRNSRKPSNMSEKDTQTQVSRNGNYQIDLINDVNKSCTVKIIPYDMNFYQIKKKKKKNQTQYT